jgi:protoporphyrinogen oxidase
MAHVAVIGAGFTGLAAALELARCGQRVTVLESDDSPGGLAGSFDMGGQPLEKFYHHWFTSDTAIDELVASLGLTSHVIARPTRTGTYCANSIFRLSNPLDLLRYQPLPFADRLRLGFALHAARKIRDWRALEDRTACDWICELAGPRVYATVWKPLLEAKFGTFAPRISAVWLWSKLLLRGGSRDRVGREVLRYFRRGFAALAQAMTAEIRRYGGEVRFRAAVQELGFEGGKICGVRCDGGWIASDAVIATTALPIFADLVAPYADHAYLRRLRAIDYLTNKCLVLAVDRSLSDTYWLNVSDPSFPFVGVIEHTNFESPAHYAGRHIVYLSRYLEASCEACGLDDAAFLDHALPFIQRIFPAFNRGWIIDYKVHFARYAQPVVIAGYGKLIPETTTPIAGLFLSTMAQIYPEDRGTNYAVLHGTRVGRFVSERVRPLQ